MRLSAYIYCLVLAAFAGSGLFAHAADEMVLTGRNTVSITTLYSDSISCVIPFNRTGNLILVKAKVDSIEGNFVLDTGAPHLVLNLTYFRHYPITLQHDGEQTSISGRGDFIQKTAVRELKFGGFHFFHIEADVTNLGNIENAKGIKLLGLLGLDLFRRCELIIDFEKSLIYLRKAAKKEKPAERHPLLNDTSQYRIFPIEIVNNRITTATEVAGKKLKLVIDCAAESNILDSRLPDKIMEQVTVSRRVKLTGPGDKKMDALYGSLAGMKMGSRQIDNLPIVIVNLEYTCFSGDMCVNGVLGVDFLSQQRIGFNFVTRKMYIWK